MRWLKRAAEADVEPLPERLTTGRCICCHNYFRVDQRGEVRLHALPNRRFCTGSNRPPEVEW